MSALFKANTGVPFTATFGTDGDPLGLNSSDPWDYPNRLTGPGCGSLVNPGNPNHYIKTECFSVPTAPSQAYYSKYCDPSFGYPTCINLRGNAGRNILTGPGLANLDYSLVKNNHIRRVTQPAVPGRVLQPSQSHELPGAAARCRYRHLRLDRRTQSQRGLADFDHHEFATDSARSQADLVDASRASDAQCGTPTNKNNSDIRRNPGEYNRNAIQKRLFDISRSSACL